MSSPPYPAIDREFAWKSFDRRLNLAKEILSFKVHFLNKCFKSVDNV
jgi:anaerobic ribonucleoside-triphosphate reductase